MENTNLKVGDCVKVTIDSQLSPNPAVFTRVGHVEHVTTTGNLRVRLSIGWLHLAAPQDCEKLTPKDSEFVAPLLLPVAKRKYQMMRRVWA